ncbi:Type I phosphodiesterase / nucleotide pyrophosphatase [Evansella caseinilytica]|uniref:Type I phosphodiesterase / nucleotide pyrophosphatase n=1 Tax=Evansella caseinilytica TaxID=1503961 RepID=A0A1H3RZ39_9BACI|nr:alkaline phosphatase family protein [Evansella caseinilytica]SDZ30954.1 Type I phosphodiesterase / nucleotide pyrophosphatase [Evansella caseinilytica]
MVSENKHPKHIIMVILDTFMDEPFQRALKEETLPAFNYFMERAQYFPDMVSPFPTMSVNVESSLLTGRYSDQHNVPALTWFHNKENRIINYGTNAVELLKLGLSRSLYDSLYRLNNEHLNPELATIHEELQRAGKTSASINALVYRGAVRKTIKLPPLLRLFVNLDNTFSTSAPDIFTYGRLATYSRLRKYSQPWNKYGFNNDFSVQEFSYLVRERKLPDFTIVYLPDHDKNVHKFGPMNITGIKQMDKQLQAMLNSFPSWETALENNIWLLIGDNGQAVVHEKQKRALVDIRQILQSYQIVKLRKGVRPNDQLALAMNLRSGFIYSLRPNNIPLRDIAAQLQKDSRIEVIAWKEQGWIHVLAGGKGESLQFSAAGELIDPYQQAWTIQGDHTVLDLQVMGKRITFGDYPDAMMRLYSTLHSHAGDFLVAAVKPGYEFISESSPRHPNGASHGGFHKNDSLIPLIVTGTSSKPEYLRVIDIKDWIIRLMKE